MKREEMKAVPRHRLLTRLAIPFVASMALVGCGGDQEAELPGDSAAENASAAPSASGEGVPNVRLEPLSEALATLEDAGYRTQVKGEKIENSEVPENPEKWEVIGQNPAAGEDVGEKNLVQLAVREKPADDDEK